MSFNDDDLKRLKEHKGHSHRITEDLIDRLLARLEAAEELNGHGEFHCEGCGRRFEKWREAAGK